MARRTLIGLAIAGAAAAGAALGGQAVAGRRRVGRLDERRAALTGTPGRVEEAALPEPVRRWVAAALVDVPDEPALVRLEQRFAMDLGGGRWRPGTAVHLAAVDRPGFCWWAEVDLAPLVVAHVEDSLVDDRGLLDARALGIVPVAHEEGEATTRGELLRWLAELPWTPSAVTAAPGLRWRSVAPDVVEVTAEAGGVTEAVRLRFDPDTAMPVAAEADARPRTEGDRTVERPWRGTFTDVDVVGGVRLPRRGEVAWQLDDGSWSPYWRGEITAVAVVPADRR